MVPRLAAADRKRSMVGSAPAAGFHHRRCFGLVAHREWHPQPMAGGELALTLAYLFPEINICRKLARQARRCCPWVWSICSTTGNAARRRTGFIATAFGFVDPLRAMGETMKKGCFNAAAEEQYQWLIRQSLRMARADGSQVLSTLPGEGDSQTDDAETQRCRPSHRRRAIRRQRRSRYCHGRIAAMVQAALQIETARSVLPQRMGPDRGAAARLVGRRPSVDGPLQRTRRRWRGAFLRQKHRILRPLAVANLRRRQNARTALRLGGNLLGLGRRCRLSRTGIGSERRRRLATPHAHGPRRRFHAVGRFGAL